MNNTVLWKPVKGYEGLYEVSNKGRIKSLSRLRQGNGKKGILKERILKGTVNSDGYPHVKLYKDGVKTIFKVHRLVVETFIESDIERQYINHKDGNKVNNKVSNLERCTPSENVVHAYENKLNNVKLDIDMEEFTRMVDEGKYIREIAEYFKCSKSTVRNRAKKHNIKITKEVI